MSASQAHYPAERVAELARAGKVGSSTRVAQWLANHDYDVKETLVEVLTSLESNGRFVSSCILVNDEIADEYIVSLDDDWYLKFWIDEDQLFVNVWSCCWDGVVH